MHTSNPPGSRARGRVGSAIRASLLLAVLALPLSAAGQEVTPPVVPENLQAPAGAQAFAIGHATGTQNYICLQAGNSFAWTFFGPQATLFDGEEEQIITHYLSPNPDEDGALRPTWQHSSDTSAIWGFVLASSSDPAFVAPASIAWLLLEVVGTEAGPTGGDSLTATTFIQRVNTAGGIAPAAGCRRKADIGKKALVPYTTDYVFYR